MMDFKMKKHRPLMTDPFIIPRVKQYLEDNVHQTYVDVAVMARQLQDRYREYSRRKTAPFRMLVEQAYRTVLHSYGLDSNPSSDENEGNSDLEMMEDENTPANHLNDALTNLYAKNTTEKPASDAARNPNSHDSELIDISSDESGDEAGKLLKAPSPGKKAAEIVGPLKNLLVTKITKVSNNSNSDSSDPAAAAKKAIVASFGPPGSQISKKRKLDQSDGAVSVTAVANKIPALTSGNGSGSGDAVATNHFQAAASGSGRLKRYKKEVKPRHAYVTFRDVGGMDRILKELCELLFHMKHPEVYHQIGIDPPRGFLLHGPPGCGKTLLAQAIAGQLNIAFIEVPATELIAGVSGESEERIREVFEQAAAFAPCVLFIDEIDAISSNRMNAQKDMERRIVAQLISSLDNLTQHEKGEQVLVVGATNRPESLDPALRRVGRFDHEISLGIPDRDEREEILIVICDSMSMDAPMDFSKVAELTPGFVGADLVALASRAASLAIKRAFTNIYRKRQEATAKNIPIVDLIDDPTADTESVKTNGEKEAQPSTAPETVAIDAETEVKEADETTKVTENEKSDAPNSEKKAENDSSSKDTMETETIDIAENDKAETETETNPENKEPAEAPKEEDTEKAEEKKNEEEAAKPDGMEVDLPATEDESEKDEQVKETVAVAESEVEAIDLDDLPDVPGTPIATPTPRRKPDLTLFEMLNWLDPDTPSILGNQLEDMCVTLDDFREAVKLVKPSAKREGFITVPDVTWDDIGSLQDIREELKLAVLAPVKFPEKLSILGLSAPSGVLLCGPPGCGKTLLAKAVANEAGINFISVKGPELMNMYVGESERAVRQCFQRARNSQPCVIFFDEFDSLCPKRSDSMDGGSGTRVVNQLLTEMDGIEDRKGVFLMAATNRPDIIDPAVLRPGRLDKVLFIGLPEQKDREEILLALTKKRTKPALADDVELSRIAEETKGYTGADLAGLIRQASLMALKDSISVGDTAKNSDLKVYEKHFQTALKMTKPSVSLEDQKIYEKLRIKYASPRMNDVAF